MASKYKGESPEAIAESIRLLKNLKRRVKYAEKRGYTFAKDFIPSLPQYITEGTVRKLKKYTPDYTAKHSVYVSPTGVKIKGYEAIKQQRSESAKKAAETRKKFYQERKQEMGNEKNPPKAIDIIGITIDDLIYYFNDAIYGYNPAWSSELQSIKKSDGNMLKSLLNNAVEAEGKDIVMKRINDHATEIYDIINAVVYESGDKYHRDARDLVINNKIQQFASIVKGAPLTAEESAYYTALAEQSQSYIVPE